MAVTEIAMAGVAALVVLMAGLVFVLSMSERGARRAAEQRRAHGVQAPLTPPPARVPGPRTEHPGPFGQNKEMYAGPPGYGRRPGYGPPPLWDRTRRER